MLAYTLSSPTSLQDIRSTPTSDPDAGIMSLAVLPSSPLACGPPTFPNSSAPSKRPKLSINTSNFSPLMRKGVTSLRLETLSATSPTIRNTFQNAHSPSQAPLAPLDTSFAKHSDQPRHPFADQDSIESLDVDSVCSSSCPTLSSSPSSSSSASIPESPDDVPYQLSYPVRSILRNSPLPRSQSKRKLSIAVTTLFPSTKKVIFRSPLTEEIQNTQFTLAHSDIDSFASLWTVSEDSAPPQGPVEVTDADVDEEIADDKAADDKAADVVSAEDETVDDDGLPVPTQSVKEPSILDEKLESNIYPATPTVGRAKDSLQWRWTIGPSDETVSGADVSS